MHRAYGFLTSLPMALSWGLYNLLISTDVIMLKHFRSAEDVALIMPGPKLSLSSPSSILLWRRQPPTASRRMQRRVIAPGLAAFAANMVRWTFWPSFVLGALLLATGPLVLRLFGADFVNGYPVMAILICGHLARATIGPAERILGMLGQQRVCVLVYAAALVFNVAASVALVPRYAASAQQRLQRARSWSKPLCYSGWRILASACIYYMAPAPARISQAPLKDLEDTIRLRTDLIAENARRSVQLGIGSGE